MMEKKKEAEAAIDLMRVQYERICTDEEKREGLLITLGQYGKFDEEKPQRMFYLLLFISNSYDKSIISVFF